MILLSIFLGQFFRLFFTPPWDHFIETYSEYFIPNLTLFQHQIKDVLLCLPLVWSQRSISLSALRWQESHCLAIVCRAQRQPKKGGKEEAGQIQESTNTNTRVACSSVRCNYNNGWQITDTRGRAGTGKEGDLSTCTLVFVRPKQSPISPVSSELFDPNSSWRYLWSC